jgi:hypothetical protein
MIYEAIVNGEYVKVKKCIGCLKHKRVDAFYKRASGIGNTCKRCECKNNSKRTKERYATDEQFRESERKRNREYQAKRRMNV